MEIREIVGIDISKETFDANIESKNVSAIFENAARGFKGYMKWLRENLGKDLEGVLTVMEHTGIYSYQLEQYLHIQKIAFAKASGLVIKRSSGIVRGKSDKIDAKRIAEYAASNKKKLRISQPVDKDHLELKNLISLRDKLVRDRAGYIARMNEQITCLGLSASHLMVKTQKNIIRDFDKQISALEEGIRKLIEQDDTIRKNYELLTSIKGVGPVLASYVIAYTGNFTQFETSRKFACYVGIAPFPHDSGTSIKTKSKVSPYGFKKIKSILHLAASSAVRSNVELKAYYERRVSSGKSKMSTLNVVRNKLVYRMFAVIEKQTPYTEQLPLFKN
jgi:transposase